MFNLSKGISQEPQAFVGDSEKGTSTHFCCLNVPQLCFLPRLPLRIGIYTPGRNVGLSNTPSNAESTSTLQPADIQWLCQLTEHQYRSWEHSPVHFGPVQFVKQRTPANQNFHERATWVFNCACAKARPKQPLQ